MEKKAYTPPKLNKWGTVADLTKTGNTMPGADGKGGSAASTGG
ncbi:MAG: lasso RiPP family leader peptide-containing protein [Actinomycetota bacterium]|nr:lasso RiPP family leader peptide-containing protein [Actinomycetota bacterium]